LSYEIYNIEDYISNEWTAICTLDEQGLEVYNAVVPIVIDSSFQGNGQIIEL
jgi:hypothetical protein